MSAASAPRGVATRLQGRVRWLLVFLLFLAGMINYMDRAALSVAAPLVVRDLHLDPAQLGVVFSSFSVGYVAFCLIGGWSADRFGPRRVFLVSMTVWSVFCGLTAAATTLAALLVVRVVFGMGEGPFGATITKLVGQWFPRREQATAVALANTGTPLGGALAGPIVGLVAAAAGWRVSFVVIALVSLLWVAVWAVLGTDRPEQHSWVGPAERAIIEHGRTVVAGPALPLGQYLLHPAILATAFAFFGYSYILYFFLAWFPSYLSDAQHLSLKSMSLVSAIPWTLGFFGLACGGLVSDAVFKRTGNALLARKLVLVSSLLVAALCVALAGVVSGVAAAVTLMAISVFCMYASGSLYFAVVLDLVDEARVGAVMGFVHGIANCAGILAPLITGIVIQSTGGYAAAFVLAGAIAVLGAALVALVVRPLVPDGRRSAGPGVV